jgi:hypothetical protein
MISPDSLIDDHKLVNFRAPNYLICNFDNFVRFKRVSRTSMLIHLMESYLRSETQQMKEDGSFNQMIQSIKQSNREDLKRQLKQDLSEIRDEWEPPMIPSSDDFEVNESWEDRLRYLK